MFEATELREIERGLQKKLKYERRTLMIFAIMLVFNMANVAIRLSGCNVWIEMWSVIIILGLYAVALPLAASFLAIANGMAKCQSH